MKVCVYISGASGAVSQLISLVITHGEEQQVMIQQMRDLRKMMGILYDEISAFRKQKESLVSDLEAVRKEESRLEVSLKEKTKERLLFEKNSKTLEELLEQNSEYMHCIIYQTLFTAHCKLSILCASKT